MVETDTVKVPKKNHYASGSSEQLSLTWNLYCMASCCKLYHNVLLQQCICI